MLEKPRTIINKSNIEDNFSENVLRIPSEFRKHARLDTPELHEGEIEKTEKEKKNIDFANNLLNDFASKYQPELFNIEPEDVHKLPLELVKKYAGPNTLAFYNATYHQIYYPDKINPIWAFNSSLHEMTHAKSFVNFKKEIKGFSHEISGNKSGVTFYDENYTYLENLNEAITEYIAKKINYEMIRSTEFKKEQNNVVNDINIIRSRRGLPIKDVNEVISLYEVISIEDKSKLELDTINHEYKSQRDYLELMFEDILKINNQFNSRDEVESEFFRAYFTGDLQNLMKIIDETYGSGTFEKIKRIDRNKKGEIADFYKKSFTLQSLLEVKKNETKN